MSSVAMLMVLTAAFLHAGWNFLLKKSLRKIVFIWWFQLVTLILYSPMFLYFWTGSAISVAGWYCVVATGLLHGLYFWFMGGAYERGDLSLVYPLSRGAGPLVIPFFAVVFLYEKLSLTGVTGIILVVCGIYIIHLKSFSARSFMEPLLGLRGGASLWALATGGTIAAYSLVDKVGVGRVYPPVYIYLMFAITWLTLTPYVLAKERGRLKKEWGANRGAIFTVGFFALFTYLIILFALRMSKVSYVAAVREVSIVLSALYGIIWLDERHGRQKFAGSVLIATGVVLIGLTR